MSNFPGDDVVGARSIAAHAETADKISRWIVKREAAAEYIDTADFFTDQRIVGLAEICRISLIRRFGIDRIAML